MSILADVYPNNNNNKYINNIFKDTMDVILFQALNTIFQYTYKLNQNNIINRLHHSTKNIFYTNRNTFQIVPVCIFAYILLIPELFLFVPKIYFVDSGTLCKLFWFVKNCRGDETTVIHQRREPGTIFAYRNTAVDGCARNPKRLKKKHHKRQQFHIIFANRKTFSKYSSKINIPGRKKVPYRNSISGGVQFSKHVGIKI
jgi:hypothetical protein